MDKENKKNDNEIMLEASFREQEKFVKLVEDMRRKQNQYFQYRGKDTLQWAKDAEKKVDKYIENFKNPQLFE